MSGKDASHFGKTLYKRLVSNQSQTEHLFEQIFLNNIKNIEQQLTDEEAQQKMSTEIVNYTLDISRQFSSARERDMAQGIIPYIMLEYVSDASAPPTEINLNEGDGGENNQNGLGFDPLKDFTQKFRDNLERLKPCILENIAKHWKSVGGGLAIGGISYAVTRFVLGCTANKALLMGGGLGIAVLLGWEVYEHFAKNK